MTRLFSHYLRWTAFIGMVASGWLLGCSVENDNAVTCIAKDCQASCRELGFAEGSCEGGDNCACGPMDTAPFQWDRGTEDETASEDVATDTPSEPAPDTGTGTALDTETATGTGTAPDTETATPTADPVATDTRDAG